MKTNKNILSIILTLFLTSLCYADYMSAESARHTSKQASFDRIMHEIAVAANRGEHRVNLYSMGLFILVMLPDVTVWDYDEDTLDRIRELGYKVHSERFCLTDVHYVTW